MNEDKKMPEWPQEKRKFDTFITKIEGKILRNPKLLAKIMEHPKLFRKIFIEVLGYKVNFLKLKKAQQLDAIEKLTEKSTSD